MKKICAIIPGSLVLLALLAWPSFLEQAELYKDSNNTGKHLINSPPGGVKIELWFNSNQPDNNFKLKATASNKIKKTGSYHVLKVVDGDTIDIFYHGKKERIRLLRIDMPERDEGGYLRAKEASEKFVGGRKIWLEFETPGKIERGVYGRILAYIWVDNMNINVEMVKLGWSRFWTKYGEGKYIKEFREAERKAEKNIRKKYNYSIISQRDISYADIKRYTANIITEKHYPKDILRIIIEEATKKVKVSRGNLAHVVWLYIAYDQNDVNNANWVCRTQFVDQTLDKSMGPGAFGGDEKIGEIDIDWNSGYKARKDYLNSHSVTKDGFLEHLIPIVKKMVGLAEKGIELFSMFKSEKILEDELINRLQKIEPKISSLYDLSDTLPLFIPNGCKDYDQAAQNLFASIRDIFLYYSEAGLKTWPKQNREWLMQNTIKQFYKEIEYIQKIKFDKSKIH